MMSSPGKAFTYNYMTYYNVYSSAGGARNLSNINILTDEEDNYPTK